MIVRKPYRLDMNPGGVLSPTVHLSQYDSAFEIVFALYSSYGEFTMESGTTAKVRGTKPDGNGYSADCTVDISNKTVTVEGDIQITAVSGASWYEITLYKDGKELNTKNFKILIEHAALDKETVASDSKVAELYAIYDRADEIITAGGQYASYQQALEDTADRAAASATAASNSAAQAANYANDLENRLSSLEGGQQALQQAIALVQANESLFVTNGYVENEYAIFENMDGDQLFQFTGVGGGGSGGGGGGSATTAVMTFSNTSGWRAKTIPIGGTCPFTFAWSSLDGNNPTGPGVMKIISGSNVLTSQEVNQGNVTVDLAPYCQEGNNALRVQVEDVDGQVRYANLTVTVAVIRLVSSYDASTPVDGAFTFASTPTGGNLQKTFYYVVDGTVVGTQVTSVSGRQVSYVIPAQSHGAHSLRVYFEVVINNETVRSNELYYEFIATEPLNYTKIIASSFNQSSVAQYTTIQVPVTVYDPASLTTEVVVSANGTAISTQEWDRTEHSISYRCSDAGSLTLRIAAGSQHKDITLTVTESEINVEAETQDLALFLSSAGRSNSETDPAIWTFGTGAGAIAATFTDFNFESDGWQQDEDGVPALKVSGNARLTIPYQIFANDFKTGGKTIEIEFSTANVTDYDANVLSCISGGIGLTLTAQKATLKSMQSEISAQYKEDEHIRLSLSIEKASEHRLIYMFLDGIPCGMMQYPATDIFAQETPVGISVGSSDCTISLYCIRVYDNDLTAYQVLDNYIADTQDGYKMQELYTRNNIFDEDGSTILAAKLPPTLPYIVVSCDQLPTRKEDSFECYGRFVNPAYPSRSFTFEGATIKPQGTSSLGFPRKNYKIKFSGGFYIGGSSTASAKYAITADAIPVKTFCFKADFASSEGANNVELVRLYNDICLYETPAQEEDERVRQGIDGFPIAFFWNDTANGTTTFLGKYNFNNDKSTEDVFGFGGSDESWEIRVNGTNEAVFKSADFTSTTTDPLTGKTSYSWQNTFEARYPEDSLDKEQLQEFCEWAVSTDTTAATGSALAESYTDIDGNVHTVDNAAYRLAKFKTEAADYMELDSAIFYYIFTELFLMVDSRAKNMFPSFIGTEVVNAV